MNKLSIILIVVLFHNVLETANGSKPLSFLNGIYQNLTIALHFQTAEDPSIISNLKQLLTKSSKFLYSATNGKARFGEITIVIPDKWKDKLIYNNASGSHYDDAHIRIGENNQSEIFTYQPRGCGQPGEYIFIHENFIKQLNKETKENYGFPEKHLVHEWAHFRYGVFDEYGVPGNPKYPTFYILDNEIYPTACARLTIKGTKEDPNGKNCKIFPGGKVDPNCIFIPDDKETTAKASIMYMPYLKTIEKFCEKNQSDKLLNHNRFAPTMHNILCDYMSTSEVIYKHDDFKKLDTSNLTDYSDPTFKLVKITGKSAGRFVFVLDVSLSMTGDKINYLHRAGTTMILEMVPDGTEIGIVQFDTNAQNLTDGMVKVSDETRKELASRIPTDVQGNTDIGGGIKLGLQLLQKNNGITQGAAIILVTDGIDNDATGKWVDVIIPLIEKAGVKVHTVGIDSPDTKIEKLSSISAGKRFFMKSNDPSAINLLPAFFEQLKDIPVEMNSVVINNNDPILVNNSIQTKNVFIDNELGKNTRFEIISKDIGHLKAKFIAPNNHIYSNESYIKDSESNVIKLILNDSLTGNWKVEIEKDSSHPLDIQTLLTVSSEPKDINNQPIRVNVYFGQNEVVFPLPALIYAQVSKNNRPVINANVTGIIKRPIGDSVAVTFKDDGSGFDNSADDGVYTAQFTQFNGDDRYSVSVFVSSTPNSLIIITDSFSRSPKIYKNKHNSDIPKHVFNMSDFDVGDDKNSNKSNSGEKTGDFQRALEAGLFKLKNYTANLDLIAPGRVTDLTANIFNQTNGIVKLEWTSPGDDYYNGNLSLTDLRVGKNPQNVYDSFKQNLYIANDNDTSMVIKISKNETISGQLNNIEGGAKQKLQIQLPKVFLDQLKNSKSQSYYFALRGIDKSNNLGEISNLASVHFGFDSPAININNIVVGENGKPYVTIVEEVGIDIGLSVLLHYEQMHLQSTKANSTIMLPEQLGKNTLFIFQSEQVNDVDMKIYAPDDSIYTKSSKNCKIDLNNHVIKFQFEYAMHGRWRIMLSENAGQSNVALTLSVTSEFDVDEPIVVKSWINWPQTSVNSRITSIVTADVSKRFSHVICGKVEAIIDRPIGEPIMLRLFDDGKGVDRTKHDGIYSGLFDQFNSNGRYNIIARLINNGNLKLKIGSFENYKCQNDR